MAAPDAQVFVMLKWVVPNSKASSTIAATSCLTDDSAAGIGVDQGSFFLIVSSHTYFIRVGVDFVLHFFVSRNFPEHPIVSNQHHLQRVRLYGEAKTGATDKLESIPKPCR